MQMSEVSEAMECGSHLQAIGETKKLQKFVRVSRVAPSVIIELPYATDQNFAGKAFYPENLALLRKGTAEKLKVAQRILEEDGFGLKLLDAYRPFSIQEKLFDIFPDPTFVAEPKRDGDRLIFGSVHSRGAAVDVTLVDHRGRELEMPTPFDDFTFRANAYYREVSRNALRNREILQKAMLEAGFEIVEAEWWHFNDSQWRGYSFSDQPLR